MYYTHVREDEQYDDLTLLGIKRKEIKTGGFLIKGGTLWHLAIE
ncbi:hypothetical protein FACS189476_12480 [Spirochaetia bacterium]|nr:hypothetical protein FACS189476_12480 [Spirochaetia bacterium]